MKKLLKFFFPAWGKWFLVTVYHVNGVQRYLQARENTTTGLLQFKDTTAGTRVPAQLFTKEELKAALKPATPGEAYKGQREAHARHAEQRRPGGVQTDNIVLRSHPFAPPVPHTFESVYKHNAAFAKKTFIGCTPEMSLLHLREEIKEVEEALGNIEGYSQSEFNKVREGLLEEYADCFLCLVSSSSNAGFNAEQITQAMNRKVVKNEGRKWKRNENGTYSHVKERPTSNTATVNY